MYIYTELISLWHYFSVTEVQVTLVPSLIFLLTHRFYARPVCWLIKHRDSFVSWQEVMLIQGTSMSMKPSPERGIYFFLYPLTLDPCPESQQGEVKTLPYEVGHRFKNKLHHKKPFA